MMFPPPAMLSKVSNKIIVFKIQNNFQFAVQQNGGFNFSGINRTLFIVCSVLSFYLNFKITLKGLGHNFKWPSILKCHVCCPFSNFNRSKIWRYWDLPSLKLIVFKKGVGIQRRLHFASETMEEIDRIKHLFKLEKRRKQNNNKIFMFFSKEILKSS